MATKKQAATDKSPSAAHTKPAVVGRYAHPFFAETPPAPREQVNSSTRMADWSKLQLGPVPKSVGDGKMDLAEVIGTVGVKEIEEVGEIRFHALGDSGQGMAHEAELVSDEMAGDFKPTGGGLNPAFLLHLGDVIYGNDKQMHFGDRFYRPYRNYPGKIIAIPGNHDGEVRSQADSPALSAFLANFCASKAEVPEAAKSMGIFRETMTQPGVYWLLETPFARIIGLYSNSLENPGFLEGTHGDTSQLDWLKATLAGIAKQKDSKALVIATHHPPYSASGHSGSTELNANIIDACTAAGVLPHAFLSAHAHNYQRYTRRIQGKNILYIVSGGGGMPPQPVVAANGQPAGTETGVTYDAALSSLGFLFVTITKTQLKTEFWPLGTGDTPFDPVTVDLTTHSIR